jgi:hypothetical protein
MSINLVRKYVRNFRASTQATSQRQQNDSPDLPNELWFDIFEAFVYGPLDLAIHGSSSFQPIQIDEVHFYTNLRHNSRKRVQERMEKNRKILQLVCKNWRAIATNIKVDGKWILDHFRVSDEAQPPIDTSQCIRLNEICQVRSEGARIRCNYTSPVATFTLFLYPWNNSTSSLPSLADILPFPRDIRVLDLHLKSCNTPNGLLKDIETMSIPLTTLSLYLTNVDTLQTSLNVPTLVNLFLSIPEYVTPQWSVSPPQYRWTLPALRNLSFQENYRRLHHQSSVLVHPFFSELLSSNMHTIQALRILPMPTSVLDKDSPLCWVKMPQLKSLVTNFASFSGVEYKNLEFGKPPRPVLSESIRYLIQVQASTRDQEDMSRGIRACIQACSRLKSITIPEFLMQSKLHKHPLKYVETRRLISLCEDLHIEIWEQNQDILQQKL